jgi:adenylate cyclase
VRVEGERIFGDGVNIAARLEALAEPGGMCISATVHEQVRNRLEVGFEDLGDRAVKNIPDQVHVYRVRVDDGARAPRGAATTGGSRRSPWLGVGLGAAIFVALAYVMWPQISLTLRAGSLAPPVNPALPDLPSNVVLPFANLSGDPEQEYFSDGITEDLTTALSGASTLFVISRNSAFTYKGRTIKVEEVGRELGVRFVLEGSVRRAGDQVRITAQLIDATTGFHVWGERYDRELADVFAVQAEISERILGAVGASINDAELERIRRKPTDSLTAYDDFAHALYLLQQYRPDRIREARSLLERAIELDPGYAMAVSLLGSTYSAEYGLLFNVDPNNLVRAKGLAERAMQLDPGIPGPHILRGTIAMSEGRPEQALVLFRQASELAPSDAIPWLFRGIALVLSGELGEALPALEHAMRLSPRSTGNPMLMSVLASIYVATGRESEAVELWQLARRENSDLIVPRLALADYYMSRGREAEARELIAEVLRVNPALTRETYERVGTGMLARAGGDTLENLRRAGLP